MKNKTSGIIINRCWKGLSGGRADGISQAGMGAQVVEDSR